jgi:hypothetical protein
MILSPELLAALREAGLAIEPHSHYANEWYAAGEVGPFHTPEAALVAGVRWLKRTLYEMREENAELHAAMLRAEDRAEQAETEAWRLKAALQAAQAELRAEREAKGPIGRGAPSQVTPVPPPQRFHGAYTQVPVSFEPELVWTLMRRAGLFIAERDGAWQWTIDPPSRASYRIATQETLWYGPYNSPTLAFAGALQALIGFSGEEHEQ